MEDRDAFLESTGLYGQSSLRQVIAKSLLKRSGRRGEVPAGLLMLVKSLVAHRLYEVHAIQGLNCQESSCAPRKLFEV